jgi:hypothetical protein
MAAAIQLMPVTLPPGRPRPATRPAALRRYPTERIAHFDVEGDCCTAEFQCGLRPLRVRRVGPARCRPSRYVRFTSNSVRTVARQRTVGLCPEAAVAQSCQFGVSWTIFPPTIVIVAEMSRSPASSTVSGSAVKTDGISIFGQSVDFGAGELDHLGPLLGFCGDEISKVSGRTGQRSVATPRGIAQQRAPIRLHLWLAQGAASPTLTGNAC